jgi:uracil-DNA glycosylase
MRPTHASILAAASYAELGERLAAYPCRRCPLSEARTNLVVDRGVPGAPILLIGEAPGAEEDRLGLAFVGRSGRLLDSLLEFAGIDTRKDILIANIVKCRPPGNRPPTALEAAACFPYLSRQIALSRPRILGLLGATALEHVLPSRRAASRSRERLRDVVGSIFEDPAYPGMEIAPLYHPAYLLRNPSTKDLMVKHLKGLASRLSS